MLRPISGASGAGKTSVRETIASDLAPDVEAVELRHLDAVPAAPDVAWRQRMAGRAFARARRLDGQGRHLLLDVSEQVQRDRLRRRGGPAHMPHVPTTGGWDEMRWAVLTTLPWQMTVIDGSSLSVADAGHAVLQWVRDALSGRAPFFRR